MMGESVVTPITDTSTHVVWLMTSRFPTRTKTERIWLSKLFGKKASNKTHLLSDLIVLKKYSYWSQYTVF